jgi:competence protein ComEC
MLIDAGGFARTRFDVGAKVVAPALRTLGLLKIDILAITHAHRDHLGEV